MIMQFSLYFCSAREASCHTIIALNPMHSKRSKLYTVLAFLSAIGLKCIWMDG